MQKCCIQNIQRRRISNFPINQCPNKNLMLDLCAHSRAFDQWIWIHIFIHLSSCKICSSKCLSSVSELHSVHKRWFCVLKLSKIKVFSVIPYFLSTKNRNTFRLSWRHCAFITLKESSPLFCTLKEAPPQKPLCCPEKFRKAGKETNKYFTHSKFACSKTTRYLNHR